MTVHARGCTHHAALHVHRAALQLAQAQVLRNHFRAARIRQVLLVGKHQQRDVAQLLLLHAAQHNSRGPTAAWPKLTPWRALAQGSSLAAQRRWLHLYRVPTFGPSLHCRGRSDCAR